ncbi:uncharacterized protein LOC109852987 [Pseudomyrmex gracilis]|uniref:uncharacterized protein LOC109852987 n=1 Tax=Pseudomyrmex gracilis TaxID=219809 RepID=UPI000994C61A|nr:uncharacterized protein LOC109852987 [Pseudomyrmex gracilis]XP_020280253.1 uncharacterized protein LOC109852987 [Pseudomyrmex gracilis]XP_020280254.1 uncharacterized protein LOC109852987 [Pseudomyrmex gracilis]XP_020280255.1 uncharacterized protein LOC109852987 [Pseudomyrmex gracilis]
MLSKFVFFWCLLHLEIYAEHLSQQSQESSDDSQCAFEVSQKHYNVTDLLRCMNELAIDLSAENGNRLPKRKDHFDSSAYRENSREFPYGNMILNLLNNGVSILQSTPSDPIVGNYQLDSSEVSNDPIFNRYGEFGLYLFNALSSISRHDDLKCVSRILCEVASGKPPGEYRQASAGGNTQYFEGLSRNIFAQWLVGIDVADTSPVLSFARAAALGYSSHGNPTVCYRAFPRCPRNPDKLVHYLNNHNGGFFQFFNRHGHGSYSQSLYTVRDNLKFLRERRQKALPPGIAGAEADRTGTGKLKFDVSVLTARQDYEKSFFPKENTLESSERQMVFPHHEESNDYPSENRIPKSLSDLRDSDAKTFSQKSPRFFPEESKDDNVHVLRFTSELSTSRNFRFPDY